MSSGQNDSSNQERRSGSELQRPDRRIIPRVAEADLRHYLKFSRGVCRMGVIFAAIYIVGIIAGHIWGSRVELNRSIFFGVVVAVLAAGIFRLGKSIDSYVETESKARLVVVAERLFQALFLLVATGAILGLAHLITLF